MTEQIMPEQTLIESVVSDSLKYRQKELSHPRYRISQVYPQTGQTIFPVSSSGGAELIFQLPVKVMNLSESSLRFTVTPIAPANLSINVMHKTPLPIVRQIQLYNQGNQYLCDIYNVNKYLNTVFHPETKLDDFLDLPITKSKFIQTVAGVPYPPGPIPSDATSSVLKCAPDWGIGTHRNNDLLQYIINDADEATNMSSCKLTAGANGVTIVNYQFNGTGQSLSQSQNGAVIGVLDQSVSLTQRMFFETSPLTTFTPAGGVAAGTALPVSNVEFKFKYLYNTIMALNKDLYFGEIVNVRIVFDSPSSMYYTTTPNASYSNALVNAAASYNQIVTLSNVAMYVAVESDTNIINNIINEYNTNGIKISIPYVYTNKINPGASTNPSITLRYNSAHGKKLRKIYISPFHLTESSNTAYMRYNDLGMSVPGTSILQPITRFYTMLNNDRLNDFDIDCTYQQDWMLMYRKLQKSAIQGYRDYAASWFWVEDFTGEGPLWEKESHDTSLSSGVSLASEQKYDIFFYTPGGQAFNFYCFAITEKELTIRPGSMTIL